MSITELRVDYSRSLSDGNFGSERLGFSLTVTADEDFFMEDQFAEVAQSLRTAVLTELAKSPVFAVAGAAQRELNAGHPPAPRQSELVPAGDPLDDDDEDVPL